MLIFADSRDPIFNSRDPNQVPKTPLKKLPKLGKVYQFALMKENVHRGAHTLTGLMFAPSVTMF